MDVAATLAHVLDADEPEQLLRYLKQQAMKREEALRPTDEYLADKWNAVAEGIADIENDVGDVKRRPAA